MTVFDNPYIKQLGLLPMPQQQQESPLAGLLSPRGLTAFGANMLANPTNGGFLQNLGSSIGAGIDAVDSYNQSLNKQAMDEAKYNLGVAEIAASYDIAKEKAANNPFAQYLALQAGLNNRPISQPEAPQVQQLQGILPSQGGTMPEPPINPQAAGMSPEPIDVNEPQGILNISPNSKKATLQKAAMESLMIGDSTPLQLAKAGMDIDTEQQKQIREANIPGLEFANPSLLPNAEAAKDARSAFASSQSMNNIIDQLRNLYQQEGTANTILSAKTSKQYDNLIADLLTEYKTLKKLGTLDKGTQELFDQIITAPNKLLSTGIGFESQLNQLQNNLNKAAEATITSAGYKSPFAQMAQPLPADKTQLKTNQIYQTPKGKFRYTGNNQFELVQ